MKNIVKAKKKVTKKNVAKKTGSIRKAAPNPPQTCSGRTRVLTGIGEVRLLSSSTPTQKQKDLAAVNAMLDLKAKIQQACHRRSRVCSCVMFGNPKTTRPVYKVVKRPFPLLGKPSTWIHVLTCTIKGSAKCGCLV